MNPLTNMKNVLKLSEQELNNKNKTSWHDQYKDSAWIFVGGLPYDLSEGDIICVFSQYGEIVNINLIREKDTGKSKGFCFLCYEDQRSTVLAVDNFNGIKILNRIIRVDHVAGYKVPKEGKKTDEVTKQLYSDGCAPQLIPVKKKSPPRDVRETLGNQIEADIKLPLRLPIYIKEEKLDEVPVKTEKTSDQESEKDTSSKKKKTKKRKHDHASTDDESRKSKSHKKSKKHDKHDPNYKKSKKDHYSK
ncbi:unnamed protein product [Phaedon cochleariae]|uniref:RRM domain-containing protein n=1 Tax=Phaedon cochleariae TaxID=80249 RepID=A0A9P0GMC6_PHACE|nr:unnamed protein product [Phaedon cochleariae]